MGASPPANREEADGEPRTACVHVQMRLGFPKPVTPGMVHTLGSFQQSVVSLTVSLTRAPRRSAWRVDPVRTRDDVAMKRALLQLPNVPRLPGSHRHRQHCRG